jgi:proteasome lid subunit RPN8/RPN11
LSLKYSDITEIQKASIKAHSIAAYESDQAEACGFILVDGTVMRCRNRSDSPSTNFVIDPTATAIAMKQGVKVIYHSHVNGRAGFSTNDGINCKKWGIPWLLYHVPTNDFKFVNPNGEAPYIGREFCWGVYDCYSLIRDYLRQEFGVILDDFERPDFFAEEHQRQWASEGWNQFEENYADQGFIRLSPEYPPQRGDVVLFSVFGGHANHMGIIHDLERGTFLHQAADDLSSEAIWVGSWQRHCIAILRHKEVPV